MNTQSRGYRILLSARKVGAITWLFVVFGPPIGGAVYFVWIVGGSVIVGLISAPKTGPMSGPHGALQIITAMAFIAVLIIPYSYLFGALPAALAGFIVGVAQIKFGQLPWAIVLLIGASVGTFDVIIYEKLPGLLFGPAIKPETPSILGALILCATCTIATFVCWRVVRNWYTEQLSPQSQP
jgi:hypothetical protein